MKVIVLFDGISALGKSPDLAILETVEAVEAVLAGDGHETVRIPVNTQDLEQITDTFWGNIYETANHAVEHFYKAKPTDLRVIEERSPENVM